MGGLFGGLLGIVNAAGGGVLYCLIGSKAWNDNANGRYYRIITGSIAIGLVMGSILYVWLLEAMFDGPFRSGTKLLICFVGTPIAILFIFGALENIMNEIDE